MDKDVVMWMFLVLEKVGHKMLKPKVKVYHIRVIICIAYNLWASICIHVHWYMGGIVYHLSITHSRMKLNME